MRVGRNPAKTTEEAALEVAVPPPVSVGLLMYAPSLDGYFRDAVAVTELAVRSAREHAGRPIHLAVVDNGSAPDMVDWLLRAQADGLVDQLVLNRRNLGKVTAMTQILHGLPGPDVVFADGDLRFSPGWLDALLGVAEVFPEACVVGGWPAHGRESGLATASTEAWLAAEPEGVTVTRGLVVAPEVIEALASDTGSRFKARGEDVHIQRAAGTAMQGALHCMFLAPARHRSELPRSVGRLALDSEEDRAFDRSVDAMGLLRLSTTEPVYRHVGNRLSDDDRAALAALGGGAVTARRPVRGARLVGRSSTRWVARRIHDWTFRLLSEVPERSTDRKRATDGLRAALIQRLPER